LVALASQAASDALSDQLDQPFVVRVHAARGHERERNIPVAERRKWLMSVPTHSRVISPSSPKGIWHGCRIRTVTN
jgi:hypothetical protein